MNKKIDAAMETARKHIDRLQRERQELELIQRTASDTIQTLKRELAEKSDQITDLEDKVNGLEDDNKALQSSLLELRESEVTGRRSLSDKDIEITQLQRLMIENYTELTARYQREKDENDRLSRELIGLPKLNEMLDLMQKKLVLNESELAHSEERINRLLDNRQTLMEKVEDLQGKNERLQTLLEKEQDLKKLVEKTPLLQRQFSLEAYAYGTNLGDDLIENLQSTGIAPCNPDTEYDHKIDEEQKMEFGETREARARMKREMRINHFVSWIAGLY